VKYEGKRVGTVLHAEGREEGKKKGERNERTKKRQKR
jgi:hypothetical protein